MFGIYEQYVGERHEVNRMSENLVTPYLDCDISMIEISSSLKNITRKFSRGFSLIKRIKQKVCLLDNITFYDKYFQQHREKTCGRNSLKTQRVTC